jgi:hypothetical protein
MKMRVVSILLSVVCKMTTTTTSHCRLCQDLVDLKFGIRQAVELVQLDDENDDDDDEEQEEREGDGISYLRLSIGRIRLPVRLVLPSPLVSYSI